MTCMITLAPNNSNYETRCGGKSDLKHPCFTHWSGDLKSVEARPFFKPLDIQKTLMIKNDDMQDFTVDEPSNAFIIRYPNAGGVQFVYSNFDPKTGCKDITIKRGDNSAWRIWVSDEDGDDRDIDTKNEETTSKSLCTKWVHIHVKRDG
ncbi:hypothetical protein NDA16_004202 [Ustilago loliicola]|nr:hypothetical protein NDA16_004202 [Ustilago loliicola]